MSGTSLDGLDIAYVEFWQEVGEWRYRLGPYDTLPYTKAWRLRLQQLPAANALSFAATHAAYGAFCGRAVRRFVQAHALSPQLVASHGHTVFHQPEQGFSTQIGDGAAMAAHAGLPVVCDFRSGDVARAGQGAPLVPIGDALLFGQYAACVNIGGFANISYAQGEGRVAYDICPANIVLNEWAQRLGQPYDAQGQLAREGGLAADLMCQLEALPYYAQQPPKSLGKEWVEAQIAPLLQAYDKRPKQVMRTFSEHVAKRIASALPPAGQVLISGGGAYNSFVMERIRAYAKADVVVAAPDVIEMKEALIFAFMGLLRHLEQHNIWAQVTGASANSIGGAVYLP